VPVARPIIAATRPLVKPAFCHRPGTARRS
jgi:hypothetical protein